MLVYLLRRERKILGMKIKPTLLFVVISIEVSFSYVIISWLVNIDLNNKKARSDAGFFAMHYGESRQGRFTTSSVGRKSPRSGHHRTRGFQ